MGYFPDTINHQCEAPSSVKIGMPDCVGYFGVVHHWEMGKGCRGCEFFIECKDEDDDEDEDE